MNHFATAYVSVKYFRPLTQSTAIENALSGVSPIGYENREWLANEMSERLYEDIASKLMAGWQLETISIRIKKN